MTQLLNREIFVNGNYLECVDSLYVQAKNNFEKLFKISVKHYYTGPSLGDHFQIEHREKWKIDKNEADIEILKHNSKRINFSFSELESYEFKKNRDWNKLLFDRSMKFFLLFPKQYHLIDVFVKKIHPIKSAGIGCDTSHSTPEFYFSIFTSFPEKNESNAELRLLESLYHEAMHLLLSAFELGNPIVDDKINNEIKIYSPWKKENRKTQGIVHGAFVFRNISNFMRLLLRSNVHLNDLDRKYLGKRIEMIDQELAEVKGAINSPNLTKDGKLLLETLLEI